MFWIIMIRIWEIDVFCENSDKLQESAIFHDHKAIDALTNTMSWVLVTIWLQNHVLIWQVRLEVWHIDMMITRFVCECE